MGIAKPTLSRSFSFIVTRPITLPVRSQSGPPEFPGLMAASICKYETSSMIAIDATKQAGSDGLGQLHAAAGAGIADGIDPLPRLRRCLTDQGRLERGVVLGWDRS